MTKVDPDLGFIAKSSSAKQKNQSKTNNIFCSIKCFFLLLSKYALDSQK